MRSAQAFCYSGVLLVCVLALSQLELSFVTSRLTARSHQEQQLAPGLQPVNGTRLEAAQGEAETALRRVQELEVGPRWWHGLERKRSHSANTPPPPPPFPPPKRGPRRVCFAPPLRSAGFGVVA